MNSDRKLSFKQRVMFLSFAMLAMLLLASGSVAMAAKHFTASVILFICAFLTIGIGFMVRKRTFR